MSVELDENDIACEDDTDVNSGGFLATERFLPPFAPFLFDGALFCSLVVTFFFEVFLFLEPFLRPLLPGSDPCP